MTVRIKNLSSGYKGGFHLKEINCRLYAGTITGIIGPNGSGKSTLLKTLAGYLPSENGDVIIKGRNLKNYRPKERGRLISFVSSEAYIKFPFTVEEIVLMGRNPYIKRLSSERPADYMKAAGALKLTGCAGFKNKKVTELSSGELKRVLISRAICQDAEIMALDEPAAHLDINFVKVIFKILAQLKNDKKTIVAVLHDLNLASLYCDNIIVLKKGEIFKNGAVNEVINKKVLSELYEEKISVDNVRGHRFVLPRPCMERRIK
jgi:iron complex transport system ATP-binding protein